MRALAAIAWAAIVTIGWIRLGSPTARPSDPATIDKTRPCLSASSKTDAVMFAARDLPINWRLSDRDVKQRKDSTVDLGTVLNRYLACEVQAGDGIVPSDLRSAPQIPLAPGKVLTRLPLTAPQAADVNVNTRLEVLAGQTALFREPVAAVECPSQCEAWVLTTAAEHQLFAAAAATELRVVIRTEAP